MSLDMSDVAEFDTTVSKEGRVVIPAPVRAALGLSPGSRVHFVLGDGEVRLVTGRSMLRAVWANNEGGDAGDSAADVRALRVADQLQAHVNEARRDSRSSGDSSTDEELTARLVARLGLAD